MIGDFNSYSTTWGYTNTDDIGEAIEQWADSCNLTLQNYQSRSAVQDGREATTPTCSLYLRALLTCAKKSIMELIPHMQHRPICARANPLVMAHLTQFRRRFNIRNAYWDGYSTYLDKLIEDVEPIPENYGGLVDKVRVASRRYIPRRM